MKCGVRNCAQNDNRFLWRCHGNCNRTFHAACVGTQRNCEEIIRAFMLPLCSDCQDKFTTELNLKALTKSLEGIAESIGSTLEANHKMLSNFKTLNATNDHALEQIEKMFDSMNHTMASITSSNKLIAAGMKNAISTHLDTPPVDTGTAVEAAVKSAATAAVAEITTITTHSIDKLITGLKSDLANSQATLARDVISNMEEIAKTLSSKIGDPTSREELTKHISTPTITIPKNHKIDDPVPSWRMLGNKKVWKRDWSEYDVKQLARQCQEKNEEKARLRRKHHKMNACNQKQFHFSYNNNSQKSTPTNNINNHNHSNNKTGRSNIYDKNALSLDKELLAADRSDKQLLTTAKVQFSGPPTNTDHPIAALTVPKFINFRKGETINPYRTEKQAQHFNNAEPPTPSNISSSPLPENKSTPGFSLDPMRPPVVNLTQQSAEGDGRFLKARLRDPKIMHIVRLYLAYLHDKESSFCHEGMTNTSVKIKLSSEGLPTSPDNLCKIFFEVHEEYGVTQKAASDDLDAYRRHLNNERIQHLQRIRESSDRFHNINFHK